MSIRSTAVSALALALPAVALAQSSNTVDPTGPWQRLRSLSPGRCRRGHDRQQGRPGVRHIYQACRQGRRRRRVLVRTPRRRRFCAGHLLFLQVPPRPLRSDPVRRGMDRGPELSLQGVRTGASPNCSGNRPVSERRNATRSSTSVAASWRPSCTSPITRIAAGSVGTEPS